MGTTAPPAADDLRVDGHLLPASFDDWSLLERERFLQRRVRALEGLSAHLSASGRHAEAIDTARLAIGVEPLREAPQRRLIEAYLAAGDREAAARHYEHFRELLVERAGVEPSPLLRAILQP
jgi:DNA-binding SARP family transcriptional activator